MALNNGIQELTQSGQDFSEYKFDEANNTIQIHMMDSINNTSCYVTSQESSISNSFFILRKKVTESKLPL